MRPTFEMPTVVIRHVFTLGSSAIGIVLLAVALSAAPTKEDLNTKVDRLGDPLPPNAVSRFGSLRYRGPIARAPDGKSLATLRRNRSVWIDPESGAERKVLPGPDPAVFEVWHAVHSPDGRFIAYSGAQQIEVWSIAEAKAIGQYVSKGDNEVSLSNSDTRPIAFSADGKTLLIQIVDRGQRVGCWDMATSEMRWQTDAVGAVDHISMCKGFANFGHHVAVLRQKEKASNLLLLRTDNGEIEHTFDLGQAGGHGEAVCALSPNGEEFAFLEQNEKLRRLELPTGRVKLPLADHGPGTDVNGLAYSVDGKKLALVDFYALRICDTTSGKELGRSDRTNQVGYFDCHVEYSGDGRSLWITRRDDRAWQKFDGTNGRPKRLTDYGHQQPISCLAMSADGKFLATGCDNEVTRIWNAGTFLQTGRAFSSMRGLFTGDDGAGVKALVFHPDGKNLIGAAEDSRVIIWNPETSRSRRSIRVPGDGALSHLAMSRDGTLLAVAQSMHEGDDQDTVIRVYNFADGKEVRKFNGMSGPDTKLSFSPDQKYLAAASSSGDGTSNIVILDVQTGRIHRTIAGDSHSAQFTHHGHTIVYVTPEGITVWELASGSARLKIEPPPNDSIDVIAVSPDGRTVAGANHGAGTRRIYRWDLRTGETLPPLIGHEQYITALQYAPDGRLLSGSQDTTALVWASDNANNKSIIPPITEADFAALWVDLTRSAADTHKGIERLIVAGDTTVAFIEKHLQPVPAIDQRTVEKLAERLDAGRFADRQRAIAELELLDTQAEASLRRISELGNSAEARRAANKLLERLAAPVHAADLIRGIRVVEILQRIGTPAANNLLVKLSKGDPTARQTRTAMSALSQSVPIDKK